MVPTAPPAASPAVSLPAAPPAPPNPKPVTQPRRWVSGLEIFRGATLRDYCLASWEVIDDTDAGLKPARSRISDYRIAEITLFADGIKQLSTNPARIVPGATSNVIVWGIERHATLVLQGRNALQEVLYRYTSAGLGANLGS